MENITFQNLPFKPAGNQVIFFESGYDREINDFIWDHYSELRQYFQKKCQEFYYLPMLLLDPSVKERMLYYAPYITSAILSRNQLKTSALAQFLKDKVADSVPPSLLVNGSTDPTGNESLFDVLPCDLDSLKGMLVKTVVTGNAEQGQTLSSHSSKWGVQFCRDVDGSSAPAPVAIPAPPRKKDSSLLDKFVRFFTGHSDEADEAYRRAVSEPVAEKPTLKEIEDSKDSLLETERILRELRENVQNLRLQGVSLMAIHEFIDKQEPLSRVVITPDYRIFLPDYNNMEVEMGALPKAVYFLFLRYPEGIICKHMPDYYSELIGIYKQLRPNTDEARLNLTITKVVNPLGNALNENIARIRKAFVEKFDEHLSANYIITGEKGKQYSIPLDRNLIIWEE